MTATARRLYLDNAATSFPKPACVIDAMTDYAMRLGASAGRGAYQEAIDTGQLLTVCRQRINKLFNGQSADHVIFTLAVRNTGTSTIEAPEFMYAIPKHMTYVADSAVGPGVEVTYSVDGGQHFAQAEKLVVVVDGRPRPAVAADYSHIHWQMRGRLKGHSVAFVRFRTIAQ